MAKDPAMLWYWSDWFSGTSLLSRFLKGCYIDLLHAHFNHGRLSLEEIKTCLGSDFGTSWPTLQKKFKQDENGLFFNEKLEYEKKKRADYTAGKKKIREEAIEKKRKEKDTHVDTHVQHMLKHVENENEKEEKDKRVQGEKENPYALWTIERKLFLNDEQWVYKLSTAKGIPKARLENLMQSFIQDIELKEDYKDQKELKRHFTNWFNKNKDLPTGNKLSNGNTAPLKRATDVKF